MIHTSDVTCLVVEDHPLYKDALTSVLRQRTDIATVLVAESLASAREVITDSEVDLVLMDLHLSDGSALDLLQWLSQRESSPKTLLLSAFLNNATAREALRLGVGGLLAKSATAGDIVRAVETVLSGRPFMDGEVAQVMFSHADQLDVREVLSTRELEVARMLADGKTAREAANSIGISEKTISVHRTNIYRKLGVDNAVQLANLIRGADHGDPSRVDAG